MELYTGELLFPTSSTYEHLAMIEKISGKISPLEDVGELIRVGPIPEHMVVKSKLKEIWDLFTEDKIWIAVSFDFYIFHFWYFEVKLRTYGHRNTILTIFRTIKEAC